MAESDDARAQALHRIKRRRDLQQTAITFLLVWLFLIGIWAFTGRGFFWPVFPILGMGIALGAQAWSVYGGRPITDEDVAREMERNRGAG